MAATSLHSPDGQAHDRFHHARPQDEGAETLPLTPPSIGDKAGGDTPEITVSQRMLSATTGSLLTGLLVTPLDVVRVRWQSQKVSQPVIDFEKLPANFKKILSASPNAFRATDLGVTACCREVFFSNAASEMCVAGPIKEAAAASAASSGVVRDCAVEHTQQRTFHSTMDGLRKIARNEGVWTLWRGLSPTLIMSIPANVIYFTAYEWLRYDARSPVQRVATSDDYAPLVAGSTARVLAVAAVSPIELFRTRMQAAQGGPAAGHLGVIFQDLRATVRAHGLRSLWRGLTLTLWRDVPFSGMYWWGYETMRGQLAEARERRSGRLLDLQSCSGNGNGIGSDTAEGSKARWRNPPSSRGDNHRDTFIDSFVAGAVSGAAASIATMPFDVGKTRTQVFQDTRMGDRAVSSAAAKTAMPEEQSMTRLLWHIFRTEGVSGLFKGWIPRTLKVAPACAIMISSYEVGKKVFHGINERAAQRELQSSSGRGSSGTFRGN